MRELPIHIVGIPVNGELLELALEHDLAVYDASYLSLAIARGLPIATGDAKLLRASESLGIEIIKP
jgi:predicted nucleic acid-binding protein